MDFVIGLDSSTTSTKAIAWDRTGRAIASGAAPVPMANPAPGAFEQDVEDWWNSAIAALRALLAQAPSGRAAALAIVNQRETVAFLDAALRPVRPAVLWLDERCRPDVASLPLVVGEETLRSISGKTPGLTNALYTLHWLRRTEPERFADTAYFVDVHGYLVQRLTGERATAWGSADPHGLFDLREKRLSGTLLAHLGLQPERFFPAHPPGHILGRVTAAAAAVTGLPAGMAVVAGGGDGQAAGLGCAVLGGGRAYLNLGTAAVAGVFGAECRTDRAFRTETSLSGDGYLFELCLRTGAFLTDWMVENFFGFDRRADPGCYERLEAEAALVPAGSGGLLVMPYWSGAMSPFWDPDARGALIGLCSQHGRGHVYRALIEAVALDMAMGFDAIEAATDEPVTEVVAIGGGARSPLWRQVIADATGRPVLASETIEASCLGAGMLAAVGAGWYPDPRSAAVAMGGAERERRLPDPARHRRYAALGEVYAELHPALRTTFERLAAFREREPA